MHARAHPWTSDPRGASLSCRGVRAADPASAVLSNTYPLLVCGKPLVAPQCPLPAATQVPQWTAHVIRRLTAYSPWRMHRYVQWLTKLQARVTTFSMCKQARAPSPPHPPLFPRRV